MTDRGPVAALLRSDAARMAVAQVFNGACAYVFLGIATRQLGDQDFAPLSVAWTAFFLVGTGCFLPLEQQLSRELAGRSSGPGGRGPSVAAIVKRGMLVLVVGIALVSAVQVVAAPWVVDTLLSGRYDVAFGLAVGIAGFAVLHAGRGIAAGLSRPRLWASLFVVEGGLELVAAVVLLAAGNRDAGTFALAAGGSSLLAGLLVMAAVLPGLVAENEPTTVGAGLIEETARELPAGALVSGMPALVVSSLLTAALVNAGPVAVALLAEPSQEAEAGHFLTGLVVARVPVFLVPLIAAIMLPAMSAAVAGDDHSGFRRTIGRMSALIAVAVVVSTIGAALLGPAVVRVAFGADFAVLGSRDLAALALASVALVGAVALSQGVVALRHERRLMVVWSAAAVSFLVTVALGSDLRTRVEAGMVVSSLVALTIVALLVFSGSRQPFSH